ncbi:hypothetical protein K402DRAFT_398506 [Aulographum hederae CBS 113979]|uniref:Uncharacterized protein n=1 Tax=Aulographum hederae CBS 113979 TaxID=1176131 RepID=A0A6G1GL27_9PEZI|nr:hypothetical protein K402DRAFT_398506 [Aulographum hederae CBS 113979]
MPVPTLDQLESAKAVLRNMFHTLEDLTQDEREVASLRDEIEQQHQEIMDLKARYADSQLRYSEGEKTFHDMKAKCTALQVANSDLEFENSELQAQVKSLGEQLKAQEEAKQEVERAWSRYKRPADGPLEDSPPAKSARLDDTISPVTNDSGRKSSGYWDKFRASTGQSPHSFASDAKYDIDSPHRIEHLPREEDHRHGHHHTGAHRSQEPVESGYRTRSNDSKAYKEPYYTIELSNGGHGSSRNAAFPSSNTPATNAPAHKQSSRQLPSKSDTHNHTHNHTHNSTRQQTQPSNGQTSTSSSYTAPATLARPPGMRKVVCHNCWLNRTACDHLTTCVSCHATGVECVRSVCHEYRHTGACTSYGCVKVHGETHYRETDSGMPTSISRKGGGGR